MFKKLTDYIKIKRIDIDFNKEELKNINLFEDSFSLKFSDQLKEYFLQFGGISYEYIELLNLYNNGISISELTQELRKYIQTKDLIPFEYIGDGLMTLIDVNTNKRYSYELGCLDHEIINISFEDYIIKLLENIQK